MLFRQKHSVSLPCVISAFEDASVCLKDSHVKRMECNGSTSVCHRSGWGYRQGCVMGKYIKKI